MAYSFAPVPTLMEQLLVPKLWMCALAKVVLFKPVNPVAVKNSVALCPTKSPFCTGGAAASAQTSSWRLQFVWGWIAHVPELRGSMPVPVNAPLAASIPKSSRTAPPVELAYLTVRAQLSPDTLTSVKSTQKLRVPPEHTVVTAFADAIGARASRLPTAADCSKRLNIFDSPEEKT